MGVDSFQTEYPLKQMTKLAKQGSYGFRATEPQMHVDVLHRVHKKTNTPVELKLVENTEDIHTGATCDFSMTLATGKEYVFRTDSDGEKQRWLALFRAKAEERFVRTCVAAMDPTGLVPP